MTVLFVTLRSIYREQAIAYISTDAKESKKKDLGNLRKQAIDSCNRKQFLTVPKLSEFGLIRKFRSASISKKNQLNRSYETQVMIKKSLKMNLNMNLNKFRNLKIAKS